MLKPTNVMDHYYLESRCMLIELAATLDRYDRASTAESSGAVGEDPRLGQLYASLALLADKNGSPNRAERLLQLFSGLE
jgi:hypothetical protein